jgi:hypothetical protein
MTDGETNTLTVRGLDELFSSCAVVSGFGSGRKQVLVWGQLNILCLGLYYSNWIFFVFMCEKWERSLVLILCVFRIRRVYRGSILLSLVLILCICVYLGIKGAGFFSYLDIFFGTHFTYKLVYYNLYHLSNFTQNCPIFTQNWMYRICI